MFSTTKFSLIKFSGVQTPYKAYQLSSARNTTQFKIHPTKDPRRQEHQRKKRIITPWSQWNKILWTRVSCIICINCSSCIPHHSCSKRSRGIGDLNLEEKQHKHLLAKAMFLDIKFPRPKTLLLSRATYFQTSQIILPGIPTPYQINLS